MAVEYHSLRELVELAEAQEKFVWEIVQQADMIESERTAEQSFAKMHEMYRAMWQADQDYDGARRSASRRAGGDGEKLEQYNASGNNICGPFIGKVMEKAIKMGESNACMRRIVAAPTAGFLWRTSGGITQFCRRFSGNGRNACAGALCGSRNRKSHRRECFSGRSVRRMSGRDRLCQCHGSGSAGLSSGRRCRSHYAWGQLWHCKNMLGLVCDPVAGLVEVPCIKRNSYGAVNAVTSAQLAVAGIRSAIDPDEVIDSMRRIGNQLPACLKETSEGGLATTESARHYQS